MTVIRDITALHPKMRPIAIHMMADLVKAYEAGKTQFRFEVYETYRSPERQNELFTKKVTKARAWQSAHQVGLAIDFVPKLSVEQAQELQVPAGWFWPDSNDANWEVLASIARNYNVSGISWDKPHFEHHDWDVMRATIRRR